MSEKNDHTLREKFKTTEGFAQLTSHIKQIQAEEQRIAFYIDDTTQTYHLREDQTAHIVRTAFDSVYDNVEHLDAQSEIEYEIFEAIGKIYDAYIEQEQYFKQYQSQRSDSATLLEDTDSTRLIAQLMQHADTLTEMGKLSPSEGLAIKTALNEHTMRIPTMSHKQSLTHINISSINIPISSIRTASHEENPFDKFITELKNHRNDFDIS